MKGWYLGAFTSKGPVRTSAPSVSLFHEVSNFALLSSTTILYYGVRVRVTMPL